MDGQRQIRFAAMRMVRTIIVVALFSGAATTVQAEQPPAQKAKAVTKIKEPPPVPDKKPDEKPSAQPKGPQPALGGYCPASYLLQKKAVKGSPAHSSNHRGNLYYLSSAEAKKKFDADPEKYLPQFGGLCATALGGSYGNRLPSDPKVFSISAGKVFVFSSERARRAFDKRPQWFADRARQVIAEPALNGYCPVGYVSRGRAVEGLEGLRVFYRGWYYHLIDSASKEAFEKDPEKYIPRYDAFCAEGVSRGRRYPADPAQFFRHDNKTYLFYDGKAKVQFMANLLPRIAKADEHWPEVRDRK